MPLDVLRATRSATRRGRRGPPSPTPRHPPGPGACASPWADNALDTAVDPECLRGMQENGELLAALGHHVVEARRPCPARTAAPSSAGCSGPRFSLGVAYGEQARRPPARGGRDRAAVAHAVDMEPQDEARSSYRRALAQMQALARGVVAFFAEYDVLLTPALAERPLPIGECNGVGEKPLGDFARSGRLHAVHGALQRHRDSPRSRCRWVRRGRPPDQRPARRPSRSARTRCCSSPRRSRRPGRAEGPPPRARHGIQRYPPSTAASARGWTPSASASAMPRACASSPPAAPPRPRSSAPRAR